MKRLDLINYNFNRDLFLYKENKLPQNYDFSIGRSNLLFKSLGVSDDREILLSPNRLYEKSTSEKHPYNVLGLSNLPKAFAEPIAVFRYKKATNTVNVITDISHHNENKHFLVGVQINENMLRNVFPKDDYEIIRWINLLENKKDENILNELIYVDKEKSLNLIGNQGIVHPSVTNTNLETATKIIKEFENPKKIGTFLSKNFYENNKDVCKTTECYTNFYGEKIVDGYVTEYSREGKIEKKEFYREDEKLAVFDYKNNIVILNKPVLTSDNVDYYVNNDPINIKFNKNIDLNEYLQSNNKMILICQPSVDLKKQFDISVIKDTLSFETGRVGEGRIDLSKNTEFKQLFNNFKQNSINIAENTDMIKNSKIKI